MGGHCVGFVIRSGHLGEIYWVYSHVCEDWLVCVGRLPRGCDGTDAGGADGGRQHGPGVRTIYSYVMGSEP